MHISKTIVNWKSQKQSININLDEHQNLDESNTKLQNNNGVSSHVNSNKRRSSDKIDDQRKSQDRKRNKEKKGPFISDPAKVYLNKNDGVYNPSGRKDSLG